MYRLIGMSAIDPPYSVISRGADLSNIEKGIRIEGKREDPRSMVQGFPCLSAP